MRRRLLLTGAAATGAVVAWSYLEPAEVAGTGNGFAHSTARLLVPEALSESAPPTRIDYLSKVPSRAEQLRKLADGSERNPFDVLVIGGGATGSGCALDAITR